MGKPRVLIVDDDQDALTVIGLLFDKAGAAVETIADPKLAITLISNERSEGADFDLIITDIRMPLVDGNEFTKQIRDEGYTGPVIAFTAVASGQGKRESNEAGIDRYFDKKTANIELASALLAEYCPKANS